MTNRTPVIAYTVLSLAWGSTYLAMRLGVEHMPPALFAGLRMLVAGVLLLIGAGAMKQRLPTRFADWRTNAVAGLLLLAVANGLVVWAVQFVTSGMAAIFIATVGLWFAVFESLWPGTHRRPTMAQALGLLAGFAGSALLVGADFSAIGSTDWRGPIALTIAAVAWGFGSVYLQHRPTESGPWVNASIQMLIGGVALLMVGTIGGEWGALVPTWQGLAALSYLTVVGSLVGFTAYLYVLRTLPAPVAGTYAYVNTVVAVLLGWVLLGEPMGLSTIAAMTLVVGGVIWVRLSGRRPAQVARRPTGPVLVRAVAARTSCPEVAPS